MKNNKLLVVVDVQNDFCARRGKFDNLGEPIDSIKKVFPNLKKAIDLARKNKYKIVFTRSLQIFNQLPENIKRRTIKNNRKEDYLVPGSWGSEFFQIEPKKNEPVIDKYRYDIFTNPSFEKYLIKEKIKEIIFCGFFMDMCIDSAMRTAYQKGYETTLLKDATSALFYDKIKIENFMKKFYDSKIINVGDYFNENKS